jgi:hypothetical protein
MPYWITRSNQKFGPYSLADLRQMVAQGNLVATDLTWEEGSSQWVPLSSIPGLRVGAAAYPMYAAPAFEYGTRGMTTLPLRRCLPISIGHSSCYSAFLRWVSSGLYGF